MSRRGPGQTFWVNVRWVPFPKLKMELPQSAIVAARHPHKREVTASMAAECPNTYSKKSQSAWPI